ncbi:MAG: ABC transporter permease [Chloroflexota bacterium]|nr:ABC transporter permease [Chloroflexota bacterium]
MNGRLLVQTWRWQRLRLLVIAVAALGWGTLFPIFYSAFSDALRGLVNSGTIPKQLFNFGSGSLFTLPGALTLGLEHPLTLAMLGIFAVGATTGAVAGERQRGTLEVLLARPISRHTLYLTVAVALLVVIALVLAAILAGMAIGAATQGLLDQIDLGQLPLVFANGLLLWGAFGAFGLAASVSFDRVGPALGLTMAYVLGNYFLEILGSLLTDAAWTQKYSLFHHFQPGLILTGKPDAFDFVILAVAVALPVAYALIVFPRRDLAAPS